MPKSSRFKKKVSSKRTRKSKISRNKSKVGKKKVIRKKVIRKKVSTKHKKKKMTMKRGGVNMQQEANIFENIQKLLKSQNKLENNITQETYSFIEKK